MRKKRVHVFVSGRVQGVYFRDSTRGQALEKGVGGWVQNLPDGRVEALFEGEDSAVNALVSWCHRGPPGAVVMQVEAHEETYTGDFLTFVIRRGYR